MPETMEKKVRDMLKEELCSERDLRPILSRSRFNTWGHAEDLRDQIYASFLNESKKHAVAPLVLKSPPCIYPPWVKLECWVMNEDQISTQRASIMITINAKPFHTFPLIFNIDTVYGSQTKTLRNIVKLDDQDVRRLFAYIMGWGSKPKLHRSRSYGLQLWRRKQRIEGMIPAFIGNPIVKMSKYLYLAAIACLVLSSVGWESLPVVSDSLGQEHIFLILAGTFAAGGYVATKRVHFIRNEGRPFAEPRVLDLVDSWQTLVFDAGSDCQYIRECLLDSAKSAELPDLKSHVEKVWYWGLDGKVEREQIVLSSRRGLVFCQVYQYGNDLFVGWDGHLNRGQWVEQTLGTGIDSATFSVTSTNMVVPGTQPITEYDLIDINCLMEWLHAQLVRLIKAVMQKHKLEQAIDFQVLRGQRQGLSSTGNAERKSGILSKLLKRTA